MRRPNWSRTPFAATGSRIRRTTDSMVTTSVWLGLPPTTQPDRQGLTSSYIATIAHGRNVSYRDLAVFRRRSGDRGADLVEPGEQVVGRFDAHDGDGVAGRGLG